MSGVCGSERGLTPPGQLPLGYLSFAWVGLVVGKLDSVRQHRFHPGQAGPGQVCATGASAGQQSAGMTHLGEREEDQVLLGVSIAEERSGCQKRSDL